MKIVAFLVLFAVSVVAQQFSLDDAPFMQAAKLPPHTVSITISNLDNASTLTSYPVKLSLTYITGMASDFSDLRFYDGYTSLPYYIESQTNSTSATVWIKIPTIPGSANKTISMRFGRLIRSLSNGSSVFTHFDDYSANTNGHYKTLATDAVWFTDTDSIKWYGSPASTFFTSTKPAAVRYSGTYNRTYFVYGAYGSPKWKQTINYWDHNSLTLGTPVAIGDFPTGATVDAHATPGLAIDSDGYLYIAYGSETSGYESRKSSNPEDISSWGSAVAVVAGTNNEYASPFFIGTNLYVFNRYTVSTTPYIKNYGFYFSSDKAATWSARTNVIQFSAPANVYAVVGLGQESPTPAIHIAWMIWAYVSSSDNRFTNIYHTVSYDGGATWKKMDGSTLTLPMTESTADLVANTGTKDCWPLDVFVDSLGTPHILSIIGTRTGTSTNYGTFSYYHHAWGGSTWSSNLVVSGSDQLFDRGRLIPGTSTTFDALVTLNGRLNRDGGGLQRYRTTDGGSTWALAETISYMPIKEQHNYPQVVQNGTDDFRFIWSHGDATPGEVLAYGSGFTTNVFASSVADEGLFQGGYKVVAQATNGTFRIDTSSTASLQGTVYVNTAVATDVRYLRARFNPVLAGTAYRFQPLQFVWRKDTLDITSHWAVSLLWYSSGLYCNWNTSDGAAPTSTQLVTTTPTANTWYTCELWLSGDQTYAKVVKDDGTVIYDNHITTRDYSGDTLYAAFGQYSGSTPGTIAGVWDDWVVRKYSAPEPTATAVP